MTAADRHFPWVGVVTLSALIFTSVTSEFLPTGLLPDMASELDVSESRVGLLMTIFAGTVVVSTAPLTALTHRFSRKALIIVLLAALVGGNALSALAPTYEVLAGARVLTGLAHGLAGAVIGAYAAHLVPSRQLGRAIAITSGGGTAAFVLGVPLGTALGHAFGWRLAFLAIAGVLLVLALAVLRALPPVEHRPSLATGEISLPLRRDRSVLPVIMVCLVVVLVMTGQNVFATYIAPFLIGPVALAPDAVAVVLFFGGLAGASGLVAAGAVTDRAPRTAFLVALGLVIIVVLGMGLAPGQPAVFYPLYFLWGFAFSGIPAMLQTRLMRAASARLRDTASAYLTVAFNIGIGGGALVGAAVLDRAGIGVLPFVDVSITVLALGVAIAGDRWIRRREPQRA